MMTAIFAKKKKSSDGREFYVYLGRLHRKDGTELPVTVKFRDNVPKPSPKDCPMNIEFTKEAGNLSSRTYEDADSSELRTAWTLWLSDWEPGPAYVDDSLDDFE